MMAQENRIGALWLKDGRNGKYMSGVIDLEDGSKLQVLVFKNTKKQEGERTPDYHVFKARDRNEAPRQESDDSLPW